MPENQTVQNKFKELEKKIEKKKLTDTAELIKQIATRDKLERDFKEDILTVEFNTSPETRRAIKARRPTQEEMVDIMRLSAEAALYEAAMYDTSLKPKELKDVYDKMIKIYEKLPELAASLAIDKTLDAEFWRKHISFSALQNFITELIKATQAGSTVTPEELKSFR